MPVFQYPLLDEDQKKLIGRTPTSLMQAPSGPSGAPQATEPPATLPTGNLPEGAVGFIDQTRLPKGAIGFNPDFKADEEEQPWYSSAGKAEQAKRNLAGLIRPTVEGIGAAGGAIAGAPAAGPFGAIAGGALGYAGASQLADIIEGAMGMRQNGTVMVQLGEAAKDVAVGAAMEAGGQTIGAVPGAVWRAAKWTGRQARKIPGVGYITRPFVPGKEVGEVFIAAREGADPIITKSIEEAQLLEETIPGLKFTRAQMSGDIGTRQLEQQVAKKYPALAQELDQAKGDNTKAITQFLEDVRGKQTTLPARNILEKQGRILDTQIEAEVKNLSRKVAPFELGDDLATAGQKIKQIRNAREKAVKRIGSRKFDAIGDAPIIGFKLRNDYHKVLKRTSDFEDVESNIPKILRKSYKIFKGKRWQTTIKELQDLRSELGDSLSDMQRSANRNNKAERRVSLLIKAIDRTLDEAPGVSKDIVSKLKDARRFWKEEYINKFKKGPAATIARQTSEGDLVNDADVVSKFFRKGPAGRQAVQQYKAMTGDTAASKAVMKNAVQQSFLDSVYDTTKAEISTAKMLKWYKQHNTALNELGLREQFVKIKNVRQNLDIALAKKATYDKSLASKVLGTDPGSEMKVILSGADKKDKMVRLMRRLGRDKRAIEGVQAALIDELRKIAPDNVGAIERWMRDYSDVLKVAFRKDPQKLRSMVNYQKALARVYQGRVRDLNDKDTIFKAFQLYMRFGLGEFRTVTNFGNLLGAFAEIPRKNQLRILSEGLIDPDLSGKLAWAASKSRFPNQTVSELSKKTGKITQREGYPKRELIRRLIELTTPSETTEKIMGLEER